jgi:hypothetical protein
MAATITMAASYTTPRGTTLRRRHESRYRLLPTPGDITRHPYGSVGRARRRGQPLDPCGPAPAAAAARLAVLETAEAEARAAAARRADELAAERVRAAVTAEEAKGLREALKEARRPVWRRWLG